MNIKYNKEIYPLDKTEMIMTITLPIHYTNVSINVEKLFEIVPITIEYNNEYRINILLPKINYRDEAGIIKINIKYDNNKEIIKHIVPFRDNLIDYNTQLPI